MWKKSNKLKGFVSGTLYCGLLLSLAPCAVAADQFPPASLDQTPSTYSLQNIGPHAWQAPAGATFNVIISTPISSKTAKFGDPVHAILNTDIYAGKHIVAAKGAAVVGSVTVVDHARNDLKAKVSDYHWLNADGGIGLKFRTVRLANQKLQEFPATPVTGSNVMRADATADPLIVDKNGEVMVKGTTKGERAFGIAVDAASLFASPVGGILMSGAAGAAKPTYALGNGGVLRTKHSRIKGFFVGAVDGVPGVGIAKSVFGHGTDVVLDTGDGVNISLDQEVIFRNPN